MSVDCGAFAAEKAFGGRRRRGEGGEEVNVRRLYGEEGNKVRLGAGNAGGWA